MIGEPRTISRIVELLHIPIQHAPETLRDVYLQIARSCGYENFLRVGPGARMETVAEAGGVSRVHFSGDRIAFHEEHTSISLEAFLRRIEEVVRVAADKLAIPVFICRNVTQRAVAGVPGGQHAATFLATNLLRISAAELRPLERPGQVVGLRLQFPATDPQQGTHQVRIESYLRDPRMLFLEDGAIYKVPVQSLDVDRIGTELRDVESFLHERVCGFLDQYPR